MAVGRTKPIGLFKIPGVQVDIDYSWIAIFLLVLWSLSLGYFLETYPGHQPLMYWIVGLVATLLFFTSVLIHELSHAVIGNRLGEKIDRITLFIFGGMAHLSGEPKNPSDELKIAAVGPLSSLLLAFLFWLVSNALALGQASLWTAGFRYLAFISPGAAPPSNVRTASGSLAGDAAAVLGGRKGPDRNCGFARRSAFSKAG